ncbi:MAG: PstS family phosphate ABC transporter substrate-binding protein [Gemmatimonadota bacterium]|nr:PstS family phosphate ABC transporter substrate-binding protein [Gemmatimonadota bacterium]
MKWIASLAALVVIGCGADGSNGAPATVMIDGSSTVFPISEAMAEEFQREHPDVRVTVGVSGTGGGFKKFDMGETDINDASRPIKPSEAEAAGAKGIEYIELPVAFDGISVVVNPENTFVDYLTVTELNRIWMPGSTVRLWSDIRTQWPRRPIKLYGPGTDSGTFDYFTEVINGESQASRADFTASEDDNVLVQGVSGDPDALAFFGFAYYDENRELIRAVPVDGGSGAIAPSSESINDGTYAPLSRPIFIYVSTVAAERPEIQAFVRFYLENAAALVGEVGYVALPDRVYELALERFEQRITGSVFGEQYEPGTPIENLLAR